MTFTHNFQQRVFEWAHYTFGTGVALSEEERVARFLEEAIELAQLTLSKEQAQGLLDHVYSREPGERYQEIGGVMVTVAALCAAFHVDMEHLGEMELARCWTKVEKIRAKQSGKPLRFGHEENR